MYSRCGTTQQSVVQQNWHYLAREIEKEAQLKRLYLAGSGGVSEEVYLADRGGVA